MTDFDKMIDVLRNVTGISTLQGRREIVVKHFYDSVLDQHFTDINVGKNENGDWPDHIFSFDEDTQKLVTVWP